jgi:hypothetical protein
MVTLHNGADSGPEPPEELLWTALLLVLGLVVDAPRRAAILVGQTLFNPVPVEAKLIQER